MPAHNRQHAQSQVDEAADEVRDLDFSSQPSLVCKSPGMSGLLKLPTPVSQRQQSAIISNNMAPVISASVKQPEPTMFMKHRGKMKAAKDIVLPKEFQLMPDFIDQVGQNCTEENSNMQQFSKDLASGLIQRFKFFQNLFKPDVFQTEQNLKMDRADLIKNGNKDIHEQIQDLKLCNDTCYPFISQPRSEIELENFSKQVVRTLNDVLNKSEAAKVLNFSPDNLIQTTEGEQSYLQLPAPKLNTRASLASNHTYQTYQSKHQNVNEMSHTPKEGGDASLTMQSGGYQVRQDAFKKEIEELKAQLLAKDQQINKQRKDFTRDLQNLRNALILAVDPIDRDHAENVKLTINVFNFNDMEGIPKELVDFFNEKLNIVKEQAQMEIDKVTQNVHLLIERIEKYKSLKPANYGLMEMQLSDIFQSVSVIEPQAFPVWKALLEAFPEHHFTSIITQVSEALREQQDDTYQKLLKMVKCGIDVGIKQVEIAISGCRQRNITLTNDLREARCNLDQERRETQLLLSQQEQKLIQHYENFIAQELKRSQIRQQQDTKKLHQEISYLQAENERIKRGKEQIDLRLCLFKWKQSGVFCRFLNELEKGILDKDSFKQLLHEDMRKLFFGSELHQYSNSLKQQKQSFKQVDEKLKKCQDEGHELRIKVNQLMLERQTALVKLEAYRVREIDFMLQIDREQNDRSEAHCKTREAIQKQEEMARLLHNQIKLKEMFEDKLRDTLDMNFKIGKNNKLELFEDGHIKKPSPKVIRQRQTKRIIDGFNVELQSLQLRKKDQINKHVKAAYAVDYGENQKNAICQTEIQNAVNRNLELIIVHDKPYKSQSIKPPQHDTNCQTSITTNIIDFMAGGAQKYEQIVALGLIQSDIKANQVNEEPLEVFVDHLVDQEESNKVLFNKRLTFVKGKIPGLDEVLSIKQSSKSLTKNTVSRHATRQDMSASQLGKGLGSVSRRMTSGNLMSNRNFSNQEESESEVSEGGTRRRVSISKKKTGKDGETDCDDQSQILKMKPTLTQVNQDLSSSELDADDSHSERGRRNALHFNKLNLNEAPNYREIAEQRNAITLFDTYIEIFELMIQMEPKLMKDAVKTLKQQRSFSFNLDKMKALKRMYPDLVPDVFTRLWKQEYEPEERRHRLQMITEAKRNWRRKLKDQGRLDSEAEMEEVTQQQYASYPFTQGSSSHPYLNPINIAIQPDGATVRTSIELLKIQQQSTSPKHNKPKNKKSRTTTRNQAAETAKFSNKDMSTMTVNLNKSKNVSDANIDQSQGPSEAAQQFKTSCLNQVNNVNSNGFYSMPKSVHQMRVTIVPKHTTNPTIARAIMAQTARDQVKKGGLDETSPHFSFDNSSKYKPSMSRTQRMSKAQQSRGDKNNSIFSRPVLSHNQQSLFSTTQRKLSPNSHSQERAAQRFSAGGVFKQTNDPLQMRQAQQNHHNNQNMLVSESVDSVDFIQVDEPNEESVENQDANNNGNSNIQILSGEQNVVSKVSLNISKQFKKQRPQTCKIKGNKRRRNVQRPITGTSEGKRLSIAKMQQQHSQNQFVNKQFKSGGFDSVNVHNQNNHDASTTIQETYLSNSRPVSGVPNSMITAARINVETLEANLLSHKNRNNTYTTFTAGGLSATDQSYNSLNQTTYKPAAGHAVAVAAAANQSCAIKAFDMNTIPLNDKQRMRNSLLMNFKNDGVGVTTVSTRKTFQRAQSATQQSKKQRNSAQKSNQNSRTLSKVMTNHSIINTIVPATVAIKQNNFNVSSEKEFNKIQQQQMEVIGDDDEELNGATLSPEDYQKMVNENSHIRVNDQLQRTKTDQELEERKPQV